MSASPKISVVMPIYNAEKFLREAVESILQQTFDNFEFLIVNDGSIDNSSAILREYEKRDSRVKIINQKNSGITNSLIWCASLATGELIARMDSDDVSLPRRFEEQIKFLDRNPEIALVGTFAKVIDEEGREIGAHSPPADHGRIKRAMFFSGQLCHPSVMFRRKVILSLGGYDEKFQYAQDYDLWFRLMKNYKVANIPEFLILWRQTAEGIGRKKAREQHQFAQKARIRAIKDNLYSKYYYAFLVWPYIRRFIPGKIRLLAKQIIVGSDPTIDSRV